MTKVKNILIVGLGNPGIKFAETRHNIGFRIVDYFKKQNFFPEWEKSNLFQSNITKKDIGNKIVILAKPLTFMNDSGLAVEKIMRNFNIKSENLIVCHDDLDINLGIIKISKSKKSAGHKGIESIIESIKTQDFIRIRFGTKPDHPIIDVKKFVLEKFNKDEEKTIDSLLPLANSALLSIIQNGIDKTIAQYGKISMNTNK